MEISITAQALSLACFLGLGLMLGLVYDLLRPLRYGLKKEFIWDFLFCAMGAALCFLLAMSSGKAGLWEIMSAGLAFCLYINFLSPGILPVFMKTVHLFRRIASPIEEE